jgi:hypothetical protein
MVTTLLLSGVYYTDDELSNSILNFPDIDETPSIYVGNQKAIAVPILSAYVQCLFIFMFFVFYFLFSKQIHK